MVALVPRKPSAKEIRFAAKAADTPVPGSSLVELLRFGSVPALALWSASTRHVCTLTNFRFPNHLRPSSSSGPVYAVGVAFRDQ